MKELRIASIVDFPLQGEGSDNVWSNLEWIELSKIGIGGSPYTTQFKAGHSPRGLYFLFRCEDTFITSTGLPDGADLYKEDVIEIFLQPNPATPFYLEFEISPIGSHLTLLVGNHDGEFHGWLPWKYKGGRRCVAAVPAGVRPGSITKEWTVEFFVPFKLFNGICAAPSKDDRWRANFYRIDYDKTPASSWGWEPDVNGFHDFAQFGTLIFQ